MLSVYNSLTRRKEPFRPIQAGRVRMYVCGMTVYDYCHLGHARVHGGVRHGASASCGRAGYEVTYVRNITDIDDKIIKRAARERRDHRSPRPSASSRPCTRTPSARRAERRTTSRAPRSHMPPHARHDRDADGQGLRLPGRERRRVLRRAQRSGLRQAVGQAAWTTCAPASAWRSDEAKHDPLDFVLWKAAKPGEPSWDSPWGDGRPGWHIECSAMSTDCLGEHFDIHGGGATCSSRTTRTRSRRPKRRPAPDFVNYWMHNGFVRMDDEKMSKSLGNFFTIREVLEKLSLRRSCASSSCPATTAAR